MLKNTFNPTPWKLKATALNPLTPPHVDERLTKFFFIQKKLTIQWPSILDKARYQNPMSTLLVSLSESTTQLLPSRILHYVFPC